MSSRTLAQLAHALHAAPSLDAALVALGEALLDVDRSASLALYRYNGRRGLLQDRLTPSDDRVVREPVDARLDHLPSTALTAVQAAADWVDLGERSGEFLHLLGWPPVPDDGALALRGLRVDGQLAAVLALHETRKFFGARTTERFAPSVALFDLAHTRFADREAREEAVRTLEDVTQRVHGEYVRRLGELERELEEARGVADRMPET